MQLFDRGEPAKTAYIGGVFNSEMLRERFRLLVELEDGNEVIATTIRPRRGRVDRSVCSRGINPRFRYR